MNVSPAIEPAVLPASDRLKWRLLSVAAAVLPAFGAAYASRLVIGVFEGMAITGSGGIGSVSAGLMESNRPVIFAGIAAAVLLAALAVMAARKPERASSLPGPVFSALTALVACLPAVLLWRAESFTLHVLCDQTATAGSVGETSQHLANLLIATAVCGFVVPGLLLAAASISKLFPPRPASPAFTRVVSSAGLAILAAVIATAFLIRSSTLREIAMVGSCEKQAQVLPIPSEKELAITLR